MEAFGENCPKCKSRSWFIRSTKNTLTLTCSHCGFKKQLRRKKA